MGECKDNCNQDLRLRALEKDIDELKKNDKKQDEEISTLKTNQAETKVYVKQILERIDDLKVLFTTGTSNTSDKWQKVVIELIKAIGTIGAIIAGIKILN